MGWPRATPDSRARTPCREELIEVGLPGFLEPGAGARQFLLQTRVGEAPAHVLKAKIDEPGVDHVGLAVTTDAGDLAAQVSVPDLRSVEAELARKAEQQRGVRQRSAGTRLVPGQHVH